MKRSLSMFAVGALVGAALLVPSAASAKTHSYWSTAHEKSRVHSRIADPGNDITWTVLDHKVTVKSPDQVVVPFVYTCGTTVDPQAVQYNPAAFQTVYVGASASAYSDGGSPSDYSTFTCDGTQHSSDVVLPRQGDGDFENGNIEVGLVKAEDSSAGPTFEHAVVGHDELHDTRAKVAVTVNASPESARPGSKITVKGTVKRNGKAYKGKAATLYFQARAGDPAVKIGSDKVDGKGKLKTKVTVTGPGTYFWTTTSTSKTQAGASLGDYAASA